MSSGILPEGMPEVVPTAEHAAFFTDPHHDFLSYGDGAGLKYTMSPSYPTEYATFSPVPVDANTFQQKFVPQTALRTQQSQPQYDPFTPDSLQNVQPSIGSSAPLQPQAYNHPQISWDELSAYTNGNGHTPPVQGPPSQQAPGNLLENTGKLHRATVIAPSAMEHGSQWTVSSTGNPDDLRRNSHSMAEVIMNGRLLPGYHCCTVEQETNVPDQWTENVQSFWREKIEEHKRNGEAAGNPTKSQKRSSSQALSTNTDTSTDSSNAKRPKLGKPVKVTMKKTTKPPLPPLPSDPMERIKEQITRLFKSPDLSDSAKFSSGFWDVMQEAGTDVEKRLAVVTVAWKLGSPEIFMSFGKNITVPGRLQQWMAQTWNSDKNSPLLPLCLKIIKEMRLSVTGLKATALHKTIDVLRRKKAHPTICGLAEDILNAADRIEKTEQRDSANGPRDASDKGSTKSATVNIGSKRPREDTDNGGKTDGSVKKVTVAATKPSTIASGSVLSAIKPSSSTTQTKATTTTTVSTVSSASANVKPKLPTPAPGASTFLKSISGRAQAPAQSAKTPAPASKAQGFSSIFDQLRERQRKDEEEAALRAKGGKVPGEADENKKVKKKKTVRWKPEGDLVQVTLFEFVEPVGPYYGGGNGQRHSLKDARSLDVEEGKDALAALKNRKALDEEDDIYIDWYQPIAIDLSVLRVPGYDAAAMCQLRGGDKPIDSPQSEIQAKRETGILSVQYLTEREIPVSPEEPEEETKHGSGGQWKEIPVPNTIQADVNMTSPPPAPTFDLSSILSQFQQPQPQAHTPQPVPASQPQPADPVNTLSALLAQIQNGGHQPQPSPQALPPPEPQTQAPNLLAILNTLSSVNTQQQHVPQPQPQPQPLTPAPVTDLSQLWLQLAAQQQQQLAAQQQQQQLAAQQQQQHQTQGQAQVTDLIALLTGQQQPQAASTVPANVNPLAAYAGLGIPAIPGIAVNPLAAAWSQYAAAAWGANAASNGSSSAAAANGDPSGKDVRERLREQAGWTEEDTVMTNNSSSGTRDRDNGGGNNNNGGKWNNWQKKKNKKKKDFGGNGGNATGGGNNGGGSAGKKGVCKYWFTMGNCTNGDSCKFSHEDKGGMVGGWKERKRGGHGGHGGHGHHGHPGGGGKLDAEAGRSEWVEGLEY